MSGLGKITLDNHYGQDKIRKVFGNCDRMLGAGQGKQRSVECIPDREEQT